MRFTKMQGAGNDYIYINGFNEDVTETTIEGIPIGEVSRRASDRHFGIGGDGIILILPSKVADFRMRMFNCLDGTEGEMCGNAIRCVARYVYTHGLTEKKDLAVETLAGIIRPTIVEKDGKVYGARVDMGLPRYKGRDVPTTAVGPDEPAIAFTLEVDGQPWVGTGVSMGNPHAVFFVDNVEKVDVAAIGPKLERHPAFPRRANIEFIQVVSPNELIMRVWERGSGITLACGTGASASIVAAVLNNKSARRATVHLLGGDLELEWGADEHVYMTGPAVEVFSGEYPLR